MKKDLKILEPDKSSVKKIVDAMGCHPVIASVFVNRGITTAEDAKNFIHPSLKNLKSPFTVKDMEPAVIRLEKAILQNDKVMIFGDYDVDGITATTLLLEFLEHAGARVSHYIPHRISEGYSIQESHIRELAVTRGIDLIITVDCGSSSHAAVQSAKQADIDIIITDHHNISPPYPEALAVVNPKRHDCNAGFEHLAGVGVIFILLICLRKHLRDRHFWKQSGRKEPNLKNLCDLVALGTIADSVPLLDDNRILTHAGIEIIRSNHHRPGLRELIKQSKINSDGLSSGDIAFRLIPRLNAGGRMDHADPVVTILKTHDRTEAADIARSLETWNTERKKIENRILTQILDQLKSNLNMMEKKSLVLAHDGWHEGVLGIVASRLVERYNKPVILISIRNNLGKGSARSIPGFDLHKALSGCRERLEGFGGHPMAAGLRINPGNLDLFEKEFEAYARLNMPWECPGPRQLIDSMLDLDQISHGLIDEIERLGPYGEGNPEPLFLAKHVRVKSSQVLNGLHRRMILHQPASGADKPIQAIQFNIGETQTLPDYFEQIVFRVKWNRWNGQKKPQIIVEGM